MSRRIEIELTSARPDGSWTWRVAGAKQPKGVVEGALLPDDAKVGDVLRALDRAHPGLGERIFDDAGGLRRFVNVFVADEDVRFLQGLETPVGTGQTVSIVPAVAGG